MTTLNIKNKLKILNNIIPFYIKGKMNNLPEEPNYRDITTRAYINWYNEYIRDIEDNNIITLLSSIKNKEKIFNIEEDNFNYRYNNYYINNTSGYGHSAEGVILNKITTKSLEIVHSRKEYTSSTETRLNHVFLLNDFQIINKEASGLNEELINQAGVKTLINPFTKGYSEGYLLKDFFNIKDIEELDTYNKLLKDFRKDLLLKIKEITNAVHYCKTISQYKKRFPQFADIIPDPKPVKRRTKAKENEIILSNEEADEIMFDITLGKLF